MKLEFILFIYLFASHSLILYSVVYKIHHPEKRCFYFWSLFIILLAIFLHTLLFLFFSHGFSAVSLSASLSLVAEEDKRNVNIMRLKLKYPATGEREGKIRNNNGKRKANRI